MLSKEIEIDILCLGIGDERIKQNVETYLREDVGDWFWTSKAAGRYHPPDERGEGGLLLHTKRVKKVAMWLCAAEHVKCKGRDVVCAAAVIHDTQKYGNGGKYNVDHADRLKETKLLPEIVNVAKMHMGPWYRKDRWSNVCELGRILYYADFIVSREEFVLMP